MIFERGTELNLCFEFLFSFLSPPFLLSRVFDLDPEKLGSFNSSSSSSSSSSDLSTETSRKEIIKNFLAAASGKGQQSSSSKSGGKASKAKVNEDVQPQEAHRKSSGSGDGGSSDNGRIQHGHHRPMTPPLRKEGEGTTEGSQMSTKPKRRTPVF